MGALLKGGVDGGTAHLQICMIRSSWEMRGKMCRKRLIQTGSIIRRLQYNIGHTRRAGLYTMCDEEYTLKSAIYFNYILYAAICWGTGCARSARSGILRQAHSMLIRWCSYCCVLFLQHGTLNCIAVLVFWSILCVQQWYGPQEG